MYSTQRPGSRPKQLIQRVQPEWRTEKLVEKNSLRRRASARDSSRKQSVTKETSPSSPLWDLIMVRRCRIGMPRTTASTASLMSGVTIVCRFGSDGNASRMCRSGPFSSRCRGCVRSRSVM